MMPLLHLLLMPAIVMCLEAPVLDKDDTLALTSVGGGLDITITCKGKHNITWTSPHHSHIHEESDYPEDEEYSDFLSKTWEYKEDSDWPFISKLKISQSHSADTGLYECRYTNWPNLYDSTFIYVYDDETVVTGPQQYEFGYVGEPLTISCFPTKPGIILNLEKTNNQGRQVDITDQFRWVETTGFISKQNATILDTGDYYCKAKGTEEEFQVFMTIHKRTLVYAWLKSCDTGEYAIGHNFTLNCHVVAEGVEQFEWKFPNPNVKYQMGILNKSGDKGTNQNVTVLASSMDDTGSYECRPTGISITSDTTKVDLNILDPCITSPYIKFENRWHNNLHIMEGDDIRWITEIRTFPNNPMITYRNPGGKRIIEYKKDNCDVDEIFNIRNITAQDFGTYTLEVQLNSIPCGNQNIQQGIKNTTEIYIQVKSSPDVLEISSPQVIAQSEDISRIEASCIIRAFPEPNVSWSFQPSCQHDTDSCENFVEIKEHPNPETLINKKVLPPGNKWEVSISYSTKVKGTLLCSATNDLGSDYSDVIIDWKEKQAENCCSVLKMTFGIILLSIPARLL